MKTTSVLAFAAAATSAVLASASAQATTGTFTDAEKALWIDRHNYFRMTALPWSAGNMLKMKWSEELATLALGEAADCDAVTSTGLNAHTHSSGATTAVVDAAFTEWAVTAGLSALAKIKAPKAAGEPVGTGVYNSYSQIVWASTSQVGCGFANCPAGKLVACKYAPAGNTASEPWYVHAPPNTQCPGGTEGKLGLCIVPGDAGNNDIAPIPAGQNAYDVFASFIGSMQKVLKGEVADAGPASGGTSASTNPGAAAATTAPAAAAGATPAAAAVTPAAAAVTPAAAAETAVASTAPSSASASSAPTADATAAATTAPASGSTSTTTAPDAAVTTPAAATTPAASTAGGASSTSSIGFGAISSGSAAAAPGHVRAGSSTGTSFTNAASKAGSSTKSQNAQSADDAVTGGSGTANNKSSDGGDGAHKFSAAGVAGAVVVGCVMIAGVFVFVSYRKNQRRQRDIMQNGGIHVI